MNAYQAALKHFLDQPGVRQQDIATRISKSQAALNRYAHGRRFPDADTARLIDQATKGIVAFKLWQSVAMERLGICADASSDGDGQSATKGAENIRSGSGDPPSHPFSATSSETSGPEETGPRLLRSSTGLTLMADEAGSEAA